MNLEQIVAGEQKTYPNRCEKSTDRTKDSLDRDDTPSRDLRLRWLRSTPRWLPGGWGSGLMVWLKLGIATCGVQAAGKVPNPSTGGRRFCNDVPRVEGTI